MRAGRWRRCQASWAPSVQNRLGPDIDISSWNISKDDDKDNDGHSNAEEDEEDKDDLEDI